MKLVYSYFVLDIVHRGHLMMLKNSKAIAGPEGRLIVGIVSDEAVLSKKGQLPILDYSERLELAASIKYVDLVVGQENYTPYENIKNIAPNIAKPVSNVTNKAIPTIRFLKTASGSRGSGTRVS